jgi:hypothetical protein
MSRLYSLWLRPDDARYAEFQSAIQTASGACLDDRWRLLPPLPLLCKANTKSKACCRCLPHEA